MRSDIIFLRFYRLALIVIGALCLFNAPNFLQAQSSTDDSDDDGLPDAWEIAHFQHLIFYLDSDDPDLDGCNNLCEYQYQTDPLNADSDGDSLRDGDELFIFNTDPNNPDTNGDGLSDNLEPQARKLLGADTDHDGLADDWEMTYFGSLMQADGPYDFDQDGCDNWCEEAAGSDPTRADTDGDGLPDGQEIYFYRTSPVLHDTDGDTVDDYTEFYSAADTDGDGLSDAEETQYHTSPYRADTDGDHLTDKFELFGNDGKLAYSSAGDWASDPRILDSDYDGVNDFYEYEWSGLYWRDADGDLIHDIDEVSCTFGYCTDPTNPDTDHDGLTDYQELFVYHTDPTGR